MKQLKIIADQYNSQTSVSQASFNESITIAPNSRIWLDKMSMNILSAGGTDSITIGAQTISFNPDRSNTQGQSPGYRFFTIPADTYTLSSLLAKIQDGFNSSFHSSPAYDSGLKTFDLGMGFLVSSAVVDNNQKVTISFVGATWETRSDPVTENMSITGGIWFATDDTQPGSVVFSSTPLLKGALVTAIAVATPGGNFTDNEVSFGLFPTTTPPTYENQLQYGIRYDGGGLWYIVNDPDETPITDSALFNNDFTDPLWVNKQCCFFIDPVDTASNGLRFAIIDAPSRTVIYQTPIGAFAGYNTTANFNFGFFTTPSQINDAVQFTDPLITYQPNVLNDNIGTYIDFPTINTKTYIGIIPEPLTAYPVQPYVNPPVRNVVINFSLAEALGFGLGFGTAVLPTIVGQSGSIVATNDVNFINFVDLAMDIINLPLASYISSGSTTGRTNTLAYFTPQPLNASSTSLYSFENKNITFIDIGNKDPLVIESLQYRIYNPLDLNSVFNFDNLSITIFVSESNEGSNVRIASA